MVVGPLAFFEYGHAIPVSCIFVFQSSCSLSFLFCVFAFWVIRSFLLLFFCYLMLHYCTAFYLSIKYLFFLYACITLYSFHDLCVPSILVLAGQGDMLLLYQVQ